MTDFQVFALLALIAVIALLSLCVVFLAVTAYALCIAVVARPDVEESMKVLPRLYLKVSSLVMGAPPSAAAALVNSA
ncbi:hypothetical protein A3717_34140 [Alcanivorax sp. HI0013]|nr:hypothetical protein A3717_34140 [Alcanivorax sp. HI0013]